jgi:hypothetical protein
MKNQRNDIISSSTELNFNSEKKQFNQTTFTTNEYLVMKYGYSTAIIINSLFYFIDTNRKNNITNNFIDNKWWLYISVTKLQKECVPFISKRTLERIIKKLSDDNIIKINNQNTAYRTNWYTIIDKEILEIYSNNYEYDYINNCEFDTTNTVKPQNTQKEVETTSAIKKEKQEELEHLTKASEQSKNESSTTKNKKEEIFDEEEDLAEFFKEDTTIKNTTKEKVIYADEYGQISKRDFENFCEDNIEEISGNYEIQDLLDEIEKFDEDYEFCADDTFNKFTTKYKKIDSFSVKDLIKLTIEYLESELDGKKHLLKFRKAV